MPDEGRLTLRDWSVMQAGAITGFIAAFTESPIDFYKSQIQYQIIRSKSNPDYKRAPNGFSFSHAPIYCVVGSTSWRAHPATLYTFTWPCCVAGALSLRLVVALSPLGLHANPSQPCQPAQRHSRRCRGAWRPRSARTASGGRSRAWARRWSATLRPTRSTWALSRCSRRALQRRTIASATMLLRFVCHPYWRASGVTACDLCGLSRRSRHMVHSQTLASAVMCLTYPNLPYHLKCECKCGPGPTHPTLSYLLKRLQVRSCVEHAPSVVPA